jgi:hypothetical protein
MHGIASWFYWFFLPMKITSSQIFFVVKEKIKAV